MPQARSTADMPKTLSLPRDVIETIDTIGINLSCAVEDATGIGVELSRQQIIAAIAKDALKRQDEAADADSTDTKE